jgi:tetratricopeptide (TPR) repeat protein
MTAIAPPDRRWVFGPIPDLLLGCGLGYALLIALLPLAPIEARTLAIVGTFGTLLIGAPHYGATLLRVYRNAEDRRKYAFFSVYLSAIVWLWFAVGLYDLRVGSAMITLYLTWSPYHYTGQNYGLAVMFLRRRGIAFSDGTKKLLYASFMLSFALAFLSLHRALSGLGARSYGVGDFMGTRFYFIHVGIPLDVWWVAFAGVGLLYLGVTVVTFAKLLQTSRAVDLAPVAALALAQALWFSLPNAWIWFTNTTLEAQGVSWLFVWAILGHSVQYLWITTYYAVGREPGRKRWGYLLATLGAGSAIWTLPALAFSPQLFGTHPYTMGLFLMIAAAVNLHHFILDGAIWKLRDTGVGAILLAQPAAAEGAAPAPRDERAWLRPAGWIAGALFTVLSLYGAAEQLHWGASVNGRQFETARRSADRLTRIGRADPRFALLEGELARAKGELDASLAAYRESVELYPTAEAYYGIALVHQQRKQAEAAERALRTTLELDPAHGNAHRMLGLGLFAAGRQREGLRHLARAAQLLPGDATVQSELATARAALSQRGAP